MLGQELAKKRFNEMTAIKKNKLCHNCVPIENFECSGPLCSHCQANTDFFNFLKADVGQRASILQIRFFWLYLPLFTKKSFKTFLILKNWRQESKSKKNTR